MSAEPERLPKGWHTGGDWSIVKGRDKGGVVGERSLRVMRCTGDGTSGRSC